MKLFPSDEAIELYTTKFENDILNREALATQLSELITKTDDPIVIALDGGWGTGKSYFLQRWVGHHNEEDGITIYYDAFESDYLTEPLISIMSSIINRIEKYDSRTIEEWKKICFKLCGSIVGLGLDLAIPGISKRVIDITNTATEALNKQQKASSDEFWNEQLSKQETVKEFKEKLSKITSNEKPIIIVIDELDRCRPDYALSILEIIKHFFNVPRMHFILGVNLHALENSVKARYGQGIDAENYLKKFINIKTAFPVNKATTSNNNLIEYAKDRLKKMEVTNSLYENCVYLLPFVNVKNNVSYRDINKLCSLIAIMPNNMDLNRRTNVSNAPNIVPMMILSHIISPKFNKKLINKTAKREDICAFLGINPDQKTLTSNHDDKNRYERLVLSYYANTCICLFGAGSDEVQFVESGFQKNGIYKTEIDYSDEFSKIQNEYIEVFKVF